MSRILFTGGRGVPGQVPPGQVHLPDRYTPPVRYTPLSRYTPSEQVHPLGRHILQAQCMLGDMGNKRAVCILLECNLVLPLLISTYKSLSGYGIDRLFDATFFIAPNHRLHVVSTIRRSLSRTCFRSTGIATGCDIIHVKPVKYVKGQLHHSHRFV